MAKKDAPRRQLAVARAHARYKDFRPVWGDKDFRPSAWPKSVPLPIGCPPNDEGTQRILKEVGDPFVPEGLELEALRDDLRVCYLDWCSFTQLSSDKIARRRVQRLKTIAKRADAVLALLDEGLIGGWARQEIAMTFPLKEGAPVRKTAVFRTDHGQPDAAPSFNGFLAGLQRLAAAAKYKAEYFPDFALYQLPRSPVDFIIANALSLIYKRHFKRPAGRSRRSGGSDASGPFIRDASGPFIRFAVASLWELGIANKNKPYAPETVARALTDVRSGRIRRRRRK
jgi:hypothetical protein